MWMLKICWVLISFEFLHYIQIESKHLNGALSSKPLRWGSLRKATSSFVKILTTFAKNVFRKSTYPIFDFGYWLLCILDTSVSKNESASNHFKDVQLFSLTFLYNFKHKYSDLDDRVHPCFNQQPNNILWLLRYRLVSGQKSVKYLHNV